MLEHEAMGRPENRYVGVRVSPAEYAAVHDNVAVAGTTVSAVLRSLLRDEGWLAPGRVPADPPTEGAPV